MGNGWKASAGKRWRRKRQAGASGRFATAYSLLAASRKMQENYEGALEAAKEALARRMSPIPAAGADALLRLGRYQECVDVCDRILEQDKGYLPALLTRQEAYFELHMAQQVVDDFYAIKDIYAGLAKLMSLRRRFFIFTVSIRIRCILWNRRRKRGCPAGSWSC